MQTVVCLCHVIDTFTLITLLFYVLAGCASVAAFCLRWWGVIVTFRIRDPASEPIALLSCSIVVGPTA
jgi:hypothetical protein